MSVVVNLAECERALPLDTILHGDCLELLRTLPDASVDAIVTDPPAGIAFMGKEWDSDKGGRDHWIAWLAEILREARRVLKPGGHALVWALPRTSGWTQRALEDADFEVRDTIHHLFGNGFPKSLDVSKALDTRAGAVREVVGRKVMAYPDSDRWGGDAWSERALASKSNVGLPRSPQARDGGKAAATVTAPATDAAKQWDGWGTALKPAVEHWILARKPLAEGSVAAQVLATGTGALNIDGCRVEHVTTPGGNLAENTHLRREVHKSGGVIWSVGPEAYVPNPTGRFPAHLILSHTPACRRVGTKAVKGTAPRGRPSADQARPAGVAINLTRSGPYINRNGPDGKETVDAWACAEGCPVAELDAQSGVSCDRPHARGGKSPNPMSWGDSRSDTDKVFGVADAGGASRYFTTLPSDLPDVPFGYHSKAAKKDRDAGCEHLLWRRDARAMSGFVAIRQAEYDGLPERERARGNIHCTVKSTALMRWLVRLITPPGGVVLDPFAGSGTTCLAAKRLGMRYLGIEREAAYVEIARKRLAGEAHPQPTRQQSKRAKPSPIIPITLWQ